jgi:Fe-S cluster biogenesis protein NfuA
VNNLEETEFRKQMQHVETLIQEIDGFRDPADRAKTHEIIQGILKLHGRGLERILEHLADAGEAGRALIDVLAQDDLISSLLLLYGLHPVEFETRVRQALDQVRPYLRSHGSEVELLAIRDGNVRLRLEGSCQYCSSSALTLKLAIEEVIYEKAPDVRAIQVEGVESHTGPPPAAFVPVEQLAVKRA